MKVAACLAVLLLAACGDARVPSGPPSAGERLESAAIARGLVSDPATVDPVGVYASGSDRVCVTRDGGAYRLGAMIDYGEGQGCAATGTAQGAERLQVDLGRDCSFDARFEGDRIVFPAILPDGCDRACTGRATLAALSVERLSGSASEAAGVRTPSGRPLCG